LTEAPGLDASVHVRLGTLSLDVELSVPAGRTVAVVGPNGAGKSTLLRALAGLQPLDSGRVALGGRVLEDVPLKLCLPPEARSVGVVFQGGLLFPHLSALDNVAFGLRAKGRRRHEARDAAAAWLTGMGVGDIATHPATALSGGQAQRVALARALAGEPEMLLLDEPTSALDARARTEVRGVLRRHLAAFAGVKIIVTHDPREALALASLVVVLETGTITQQGSPAEVAARPRSPWTAELVGLNLFRGVATGSEVALVDGGHLKAAAMPGEDLPDGEVLALVHPRAVTLHLLRPEGSARNTWPGTVSELDPQGERVRVQVHTADERDRTCAGPVIVAEVTVASVEELGLRPGRAVWASVKATDVSLYEA